MRIKLEVFALSADVVPTIFYLCRTTPKASITLNINNYGVLRLAAASSKLILLLYYNTIMTKLIHLHIKFFKALIINDRKNN